MPETYPCPLCRRPDRGRRSSGDDWMHVTNITCDACGRFSSDADFIADNRDPAKIKGIAGIRRAIRLWNDEHDGRPFPTRLDTDTRAVIAASRPPLPTVMDQMDEVVRLLARYTRAYGARTEPETWDVWGARLGLASGAQANDLIVGGCADFVRSDNDSGQAVLSLKPEGWRRARELDAHLSARTTAFVARWFHPRIAEIWESGFARGIRDASLNPVCADGSDRLGQIDDEIVAGIRSARVVVVDLTGDRGGVYFEAGLAEGLGIPVIYTCNDAWLIHADERHHAQSESIEPGQPPVTWLQRVHFDVNHRNILLWSSAEDLAVKLTNRLLANGIGHRRTEAAVR